MSERFKVVLQPEALENLGEQYAWLRERSPRTADKWINSLLQAIEELEVSPARCSIAPESQFFVYEIRHLLHGPSGRRHRVLFTIREQEVHVLFVRHYAQDWLRQAPQSFTE